MPDKQHKRKLCKRCKRRRFSKFFTKDCSKSDGLRAYCKDCVRFVSGGIEEILWKNQKGMCYYCSESLIKLGYHLEHKIPLSRAGFHDDSNLCLSCPQCNFRKGCKTEEEFCSLGGV